MAKAMESGEGFGVVLGQAIRWARNSRRPRLTQRELAIASRVPEGTIASLEVGKSETPRNHSVDPLVALLGYASPQALISAYRHAVNPNGGAVDVPALMRQAEDVARSAGRQAAREEVERHGNLEHMPISDVLGGPRIPLVAFTSAGLGGGGPVTGYEYVAPEQMYGAQLRAARVVGGCMAPEVEEGDIVIFDASRREPRNGQLIVATLLDTDEAVLKRFYREGQMVHLQPNRGEPITVQGDRLLIEGIVIEVRRRYNGPA